MEDLFKKFVNAGVGYLAQGNKKVQATIDALVKDSKLTEKEGKKIVDELMKNGETKRLELEKQFMGLTDRLRSTVGMGTDGKAKATKGSAKKMPAKPAAGRTIAKTANTVASKVAGATKKAADRVSAAADTAQRSAAARANAPAKPAAKAAAKPAAKPAVKAAAKPATKAAAKPAATTASAAPKASDNNA